MRKDLMQQYEDPHYTAYEADDSYGTHLSYLRDLVNYLWQRFTPQTVLDVGCGIADMVSLFREKGALAYGFDPSSTALSKASVGARGYLWRGVADMGHLPVKTGCVDLVIAHGVVEHLAYPEHFLGEAARIIRPGGMMVVVIPTLCFGGRNLWRRLGLQRDPGHIALHTRAYWITRFDRYGFRVEASLWDLVKRDLPSRHFVARKLYDLGPIGRSLALLVVWMFRSSFLLRRV